MSFSVFELNAARHYRFDFVDIKDVMCLHMVLSEEQFLLLKMKFIRENVWRNAWNDISAKGLFRGIDVNLFALQLGPNTSLRDYLTKVAIYTAAGQVGYEALDADINTNGIVNTILQDRIKQMRLVYQKKQGKHEFTPEERTRNYNKLWDYLREDLRVYPL